MVGYVLAELFTHAAKHGLSMRKLYNPLWDSHETKPEKREVCHGMAGVCHMCPSRSWLLQCWRSTTQLKRVPKFKCVLVDVHSSC